MAEALRRTGFSRNGTILVVGASGGPDSTALLRCLHRLRDEHGLSLHVAHLNHDFRGDEADADAAFVQELAARLGLPCTVDQQDPVQYQRERGISSFEQGAREMRYSFLADTARTAGAAAVAVGHTADDQAETVLLHLLRGAGLHGLRGMTELASWPWPEQCPAPALFRPLLSVAKSDTAAYCRDLGQDYRQDSGNYLWRFARNRVRQDLLPRLAQDYNPRVGDALVRLGKAAAEQVDFVEGELDRAWTTLAVESPGKVRLLLPALASMHPALQRLALRRAYGSVFGDARRLSETHLAAMMDLLTSERGGRSIDLPRGGRARRLDNTLLLTRNDAPNDSNNAALPDLVGEYALALPTRPGEQSTVTAGPWLVTMQAVPAGGDCPWPGGAQDRSTACFDLQSLADRPVMVRAWLPGDRFQPSGMTGNKKLQDFFTDVKAPREARRRVPLLVAGGRIAWVAGYRIAEWAAAGAADSPLWVRFAPDPPPPGES